MYTNAAEIDAWKQRDVDARTYIYSTIKAEQQANLQGCTTSHQMWTRIQTEYAELTAENGHLLMAKFFECKFKPGKRQPLCKSTTFTKLVHCTQGQPVMSFITTVQQIAAQLTDLQSPVTDLQVMSKILMSLPPSYRHFLSAWDSVPTAEKTIALLTSRLLKEEKITSIHNQGQPDANDMAYLTGFQTQPCKNR